MSATPVDWSARSVAISGAAAVCGLVIAIGLRQASVFQNLDRGVFLIGGLCGGLAMVLMHRDRPLLIFLVFVPVLTFLSFVVFALSMMSVFPLLEP